MNPVNKSASLLTDMSSWIDVCCQYLFSVLINHMSYDNDLFTALTDMKQCQCFHPRACGICKFIGIDTNISTKFKCKT